MSDLAMLDAPDDMRSGVVSCVGWSETNTVTDAASATRTAEHLQAVKSQQKAADEFFDPPIKQAHQLHKTLVARKKIITDPLARSEAIDKSKVLAWRKQEDDKRLAEQRRLQAEADAKARREREALEKRAAALKTPEKKEAALAEAQAVVAPVIHVAPVEKASGIVTRKIWKARVVDAANVPREFLMVDEKKLDQYARMMKEGARVDGVEFYSEEQLAAKAG